MEKRKYYLLRSLARWVSTYFLREKLRTHVRNVITSCRLHRVYSLAKHCILSAVVTMSTSDEDHTSKEGMSKGEPATGKRKEPPRHDEEAHSDDVSPDVGEDFNTSSLLEMSRSERKREREKKRRGDVNQGLDQLMMLVFAIDPELKAEAEERHRKSHSNRVASRSEPEALLSRVELINAAVTTLHRVHQENEERRMVISQLSRELLSNGGSAGPLSQPIPSSFATSYSNHDGKPPGVQVIPSHLLDFSLFYFLSHLLSCLLSLPLSSSLSSNA